MNKNVVTIEDWSVVEYEWKGLRRDPVYEEFKPFAEGFSLHGKVYGHPKIEDGHRAHTSKIVGLLDDHVVLGHGLVVVTTSGTKYKLGHRLPAYKAWIEVTP